MESHVIGPGGWLYVELRTPLASEAVDRVATATRAQPLEELAGFRCGLLSPPVPLPQYRAMDVGPHAKTLSTAVTSVCVARFEGKPRGRWLKLSLGQRTYYVMLVPDSAAAAPLSHFSHRLYVLCRQPQCDLSPLFALADPLDYPHHAARVVRSYVTGPLTEERGRWLPSCDYGLCPQLPADHWKMALDILADPESLHTLFRLVYDRLRAVRAAGYRLGLWRANPNEVPDPDDVGITGFTRSASLALLLVAHMIPFERISPLLNV